MRLIGFLTLACVAGFLSSCGCNCNQYPESALKDYKPNSSKQFR
ncbi:hypothetical protein [Akkermansia biwaensis]